jgi:hypothetical protein
VIFDWNIWELCPIPWVERLLFLILVTGGFLSTTGAFSVQLNQGSVCKKDEGLKVKDKNIQNFFVLLDVHYVVWLDTQPPLTFFLFFFFGYIYVKRREGEQNTI